MDRLPIKQRVITSQSETFSEDKYFKKLAIFIRDVDDDRMFLYPAIFAKRDAQKHGIGILYLNCQFGCKYFILFVLLSTFLSSLVLF